MRGAWLRRMCSHANGNATSRAGTAGNVGLSLGVSHSRPQSASAKVGHSRSQSLTVYSHPGSQTHPRTWKLEPFHVKKPPMKSDRSKSFELQFVRWRDAVSSGLWTLMLGGKDPPPPPPAAE